ncbi:MAG: hypothetical protein K8I60_17840, partial [Anaerolineae bacterium]|nr:hypothetical protein [Anaerolineae bacterium]
AALVLLPWVMAASSGVVDRSPYTPLIFLAMTLVIAAVNLFSIGTVFNYIVSMFHRRPIRQGLLGRPVFRKPLEQRFGSLGALLTLVGLVLFIAAALTNSSNPAWPLLVLSAMFVMTGIQLMTSWLLVKLLGELTQRDLKAESDLGDRSDDDNAVVVTASTMKQAAV